MNTKVKDILDYYFDLLNTEEFIANDPISIPHKFSKKQDIEIMGFWTSMLAWGRRATIINKSNELIQLMDGSPHDFIVNHEEKDREAFLGFKHRTFQPIDTLYFLEFLQHYYKKNDSLEDAFAIHIEKGDKNVENALTGFHNLFFSLEDAPHRTKKHVATPERKSTCKKLNMFLRWMVRNDERGVDFGIWNKIHSSMLLIPYDVHVERLSHKLGLTSRTQRDWKTVLEVTESLKAFDKNDPVKYDYALFGIGVNDIEI